MILHKIVLGLNRLPDVMVEHTRGVRLGEGYFSLVYGSIHFGHGFLFMLVNRGNLGYNIKFVS